jgi:hypothetical protein
VARVYGELRAARTQPYTAFCDNKIITFFLRTDFMFLITTSFVFFLFKPFITQLKLAILKKTAYTSVFFTTDSGLSLILILKPLYTTVINTNVTKPLNNNIKKPLNLFLYLFNAKKIY